MRTTEYELLYDNFSRNFPDYWWHGRLAQCLILKAKSILTGGARIIWGNKVQLENGKSYSCVLATMPATADNAPDGKDGAKYWIEIEPDSALGIWTLDANYYAQDNLAVITEKKRLHDIERGTALWILEKADNPSIENFLMPEKEFQPFIENESLYTVKGRIMPDADVFTIVENQFRSFSRAKQDRNF